MDIHARKLKLIEWILSLGDVNLISQLENIATHEPDWWRTLSADEQASIMRGLEQASRGEIRPHSKVMEEFKKWRSGEPSVA